MKGANWIPADSFVTRMTDERYRFLLQSAVDANMNMLRVWGGGIYEDDRFYDLCDELGLLVWQDFMFACSMYPGDDAVRRERPPGGDRKRPPAAQPPQPGAVGGQQRERGRLEAVGLADQVRAAEEGAGPHLGATTSGCSTRCCPRSSRPKIRGASTRAARPARTTTRCRANKRGWGDMHYWGVWHAENPYEAYADNISRFMSEYGFQSFPELASVARYTTRDTDWNIESPVMLSHQRHPRGNPLIRTYMDRDFRKPKDFASFLYVGQVLQAIVIKYAAEAHRRAMGHNWGSLYWQLDDCWPVASWSSIDYYGRWKALQYFARRFFAPVLVSPVDRQGRGDRSGRSPIGAPTRRARLTARLLDFAGSELARREQDVCWPPTPAALYMTFPETRDPEGRRPDAGRAGHRAGSGGRAAAALSRATCSLREDART